LRYRASYNSLTHTLLPAERRLPLAKKVVHFEVIGNDGKRLQDFYARLFDWRIDANNPMNYGLVNPEDSGLAGGIASGPDGSSRVTFYVEVEDLNEYLQKVESLGGKTLMGPMDVPGGPQLAMFADPEGHVIGLTRAASM
jgi:predicted enzyme related to lactoylglutathione lyase